MQLWHGTNDTLVPYQLLQESIEQWTNVFGLSQTPTSTDTPQANWNRRRYADASGTVQVEAYSIQGAGHSLPSSGMAPSAIQFFGLTGTGAHEPAARHRADDPAARADDPAARPGRGCRVSYTAELLEQRLHRERSPSPTPAPPPSTAGRCSGPGRATSS